MPYISIESGKLTAEQKKQLIERLTATASEITHIPEQFFTVTIKELPDENFGIGGKPINEIKQNYKAFNMISKKGTEKNAVPSISLDT